MKCINAGNDKGQSYTLRIDPFIDMNVDETVDGRFSVTPSFYKTSLVRAE